MKARDGKVIRSDSSRLLFSALHFPRISFTILTHLPANENEVRGSGISLPPSTQPLLPRKSDEGKQEGGRNKQWRVLSPPFLEILLVGISCL